MILDNTYDEERNFLCKLPRRHGYSLKCTQYTTICVFQRELHIATHTRARALKRACIHFFIPVDSFAPESFGYLVAPGIAVVHQQAVM